MATNNDANIATVGLQSFSAGTFSGRTLTGTTNQYAVASGDGDAGDPTVSFDTYRILNTQPSFLVTMTTPVTNATGNGTNYTVVYNNVVFNQAVTYNNTTGILTVPFTGKWFFYTSITLQGLLVTHTTSDIDFSQVGVADYIVRTGSVFPILGADGLVSIQGGIMLSMGGTATFKVILIVNGGTKVVGVTASSWLAGYQLV